MTSRCGALLIVWLLASSAAGTQGVARDRTAAPTARGGTSSLAGRVVSVEGSPVRRAQIQLSSSDGRVRRNATTDGDVGYAFAELPAGRYTIRASKGGYVSFAFGQRALDHPPSP